MTLKILFVNALLIISAATVYGQSLDLSTYTPMYYDHSTGRVIQEPEKKQQDDIQIIAYSGGYPFSISGDIRSLPS